MIRVATKNDINNINELGSKFISNFTKTYNVENYLNNSNYIILINEDEIINAFLIVYKNIDYYELEAIFVLEEYRGNKIASSLFEYFLKELNKGDQILLEVAVNNYSAINLYKKLDFETINVRKKYYQDIDAYVMKKVIK